MKDRVSRRVPEEKAATPDEIRRAIEALTEAEAQRIDRFAKNRARKLGHIGRALDLTEVALLGEAVTSLLEGTRRWNRENVDLPGFLIGAMRSIANNMARTYDPISEPVLQSDLTRSHGAEPGLTAFDTAASTGLNPEDTLLVASEQASAEKFVAEIERLFVGDQDALDVLDGWRAEMTGPEIRQALGFGETQWNTTVRRIRRTIKAKGLMGDEYVQ